MIGTVEQGDRWGWCQQCGHGWLCHAVYEDCTYTDRVWVPCTAPLCRCPEYIQGPPTEQAPGFYQGGAR